MNRCVAVVTSVVALLGSSCSTSDGTSTDSPSDSIARAREAETGQVEADGAPDSVDRSGASDPSDSGDESPSDFCSAITAIREASLDVDETFGPEARQLFVDLQDAAPPELRDDVTVVIDALDAIAELGISTTDDDDPGEDDPDAADAAYDILLDPDFTEANENLEAYTSKECGIDLRGSEDVDEFDPDAIEIPE